MSGIGLLNEKPLHASLKAWYAMPGDQFEVAVEGFVVDIVRGDVLLEIQTRGLANMKSKLATLLRSHRVRLIHPIALEKWIVKPAVEGAGDLTRRRSPRAGRVEDLFKEMVAFPQLLSHPNFSLEVLLIREEEVRRFEGTKRRWRTKGWATEERRLLEVVGRRLFETPEDWLALLPEGIGAFTAKDLATALGIQVRLAQRMVYCLRKVMAIDLIGMRGRAHTYALAAAAPQAVTDTRRRRKTRRSDVRSST